MDNVCIDRLSPDQLEHLIDRADIDRGSTDDRAIALWWVLTWDAEAVKTVKAQMNAAAGISGGLAMCPKVRREPEP